MLLACRNEELRLVMGEAGLALRMSMLLASEDTEKLRLTVGGAGLALRMSVLLACARKNDNVWSCEESVVSAEDND